MKLYCKNCNKTVEVSKFTMKVIDRICRDRLYDRRIMYDRRRFSKNGDK